MPGSPVINTICRWPREASRWVGYRILTIHTAGGPIGGIAVCRWHSVYIVESEQEAIQFANATTFGFWAVRFSARTSIGPNGWGKIDSGMVFINQVAFDDTGDALWRREKLRIRPRARQNKTGRASRR